MKCKACNGTGKIKAIDFAKPDWKDIEKACPICCGSGVIEQTKFDFMQSCTMEEMVEMLTNESKNVINDFKNFDFKREHKEFWEMWLKQPYREG